jgi:heme/copper-type cytochrome/quinol oxidase subunit 2
VFNISVLILNILFLMFYISLLVFGILYFIIKQCHFHFKKSGSAIEIKEIALKK